MKRPGPLDRENHDRTTETRGTLTGEPCTARLTGNESNDTDRSPNESLRPGEKSGNVLAERTTRSGRPGDDIPAPGQEGLKQPSRSRRSLRNGTWKKHPRTLDRTKLKNRLEREKISTRRPARANGAAARNQGRDNL